MTYKIVPAVGFDFLTPFYDFLVSLIGYGQNLKKKILDLINLKKDQKLLDIGCGTGTFLVLVKKFYPYNELIGVDPDPKILQIARKKAAREKLPIKFVKASAEELPFKSNSFDCIVSTLVFHHLPTDVKKQALQEISRVLKPTGQFVLVDFGQIKNHLIRFLFSLESIFEEAQYVKDNIDGQIPIFFKKANLKVKEARTRYRGLQFLLATKT